MQPRDAAAAVVDALTPSRWQVVTFGIVFVWPWVIGQAFILLQALRFVFRVWEWLT